MTSNLASMSSAQLRAVMKEVAALKKAATENERAQALAAYVPVLQPLFDEIVTREDYTDKDDSAWAGFSVRTIPVVVDGVNFTVSVTITNADRTAEKKLALEAEARAFLEAQAAATA